MWSISGCCTLGGGLGLEKHGDVFNPRARSEHRRLARVDTAAREPLPPRSAHPEPLSCSRLLSLRGAMTSRFGPANARKSC